MLKLFRAISGKINPEAGTILGVSVITVGEAKTHNIQIDATTLAQVKQVADTFEGGVRVKMDHGTGFSAIVGVLKNFVIEGNQLRADLHLLREHEASPKILEMAQTIPESFGLSIAFSGERETIGGAVYARCSELYSVDLVDDPAANPSGLFGRVDSLKNIMISEIKALWEKLGEKIQSLSTAPDANGLAGFKAQLTELGNKIATELAQSQSDLATAKQTIASLGAEKTDLSAKLTKATEEVNARDTQLSTISTQLSTALTGLKQEVKADATTGDKITALQGAVTNTLASMGIDPADIPTAGEKGSKVSSDAIVKQFQAETDPRKKAALYRQHKAAIQAAKSNRK